MRKILGTGVVVLLIVVGAIACVNWWLQARQARHLLENFVEKINAGPMRFTYDAAEVSGFPSKVMLSIVNPHLTGQPQPGWTEDIALDGNIAFSVNALSNRYTLSVSGAWKNKSASGTEITVMHSQPAGDLVCSLQMKPLGGFMAASLWNFRSLANYGEEFLNDLRLIDCVIPENTLSNQETQATLMHNGAGRIYILSEPQDNERQVRFYVKSTDVEATPEGDKVLARYLRAMLPTYAASKFSAYGKQNSEIDISYTGPVNWRGDIKSLPIDIHFNKFFIANQAYSVNGAFSFINTESNGSHTTKLNFKFDGSVSESYDALVQDMTKNAVNQFYAENNSASPWASVRQRYTPEALYALAAPAVPNLHSLGTMVLALDAGYVGNRDFTAGDLTLGTLEISASPYGITGKGSGKRIAGTPIPAANITINCNNCLRLVDDVTDYANRLQKFLVAVNPATAPAMITPERAGGFKQFLQTLAAVDAANPHDFTYAVINEGVSGITVNGKRMDEIWALYNQYVAPPKPQPVAH